MVNKIISALYFIHLRVAFLHDIRINYELDLPLCTNCVTCLMKICTNIYISYIHFYEK